MIRANCVKNRNPRIPRNSRPEYVVSRIPRNRDPRLNTKPRDAEALAKLVVESAAPAMVPTPAPGTRTSKVEIAVPGIGYGADNEVHVTAEYVACDGKDVVTNVTLRQGSTVIIVTPAQWRALRSAADTAIETVFGGRCV